MPPGHILVVVSGKCGGVALRGEDGVPAGLFRCDLVDPTRPLLDAEWLLDRRILQAGSRVVWGDETDIWCPCGQVCFTSAPLLVYA